MVERVMRKKRAVNIIQPVIPVLEIYPKGSSKKIHKISGWKNAYLSVIIRGR